MHQNTHWKKAASLESDVQKEYIVGIPLGKEQITVAFVKQP
jgi:hypothetical protein